MKQGPEQELAAGALGGFEVDQIAGGQHPDGLPHRRSQGRKPGDSLAQGIALGTDG